MKQITEDYVSYETAKLLKEKGFRAVTNRYYNAQYGQIRTVSDSFMMDWNDEEYMKSITMPGAIAIPTHQMALKWLREAHNIHISAQPDYPSKTNYKLCWCWTVDVLHKDCFEHKKHQCYIDTYEEAVEAALKYTLENLI